MGTVVGEKECWLSRLKRKAMSVPTFNLPVSVKFFSQIRNEVNCLLQLFCFYLSERFEEGDTGI
jgi:hypothetical protein